MRLALVPIALVLALVGGLLAYWFLAVPDHIAADYRDSAEPEHVRLADRLARVETRFDLRSDAYGAVNRARRALRQVDRDELLDIGSRPLLGGTGPVEESEAIAGEERAYLRAADGAVDAYERSVDQVVALQRLDDRSSVVLARGLSAVPNRTVLDVELLTFPLDSLATRLARLRERYRSLDVPPAARPERDRSLASIGAIAGEVRRASAAFERRDNRRAGAAMRRLERRVRRLDRHERRSLARTFESPAARRALDELEARDARIRRAYDSL